MSISMGTENKKHVAAVASLLGVIVLLTAWELGIGRGPARAATIDRPVDRHLLPRAASAARRAELTGAEFTLRIAQLARSEGVAYSKDGRDLFNASSGEVAIEAPAAPPRPLPPLEATVAAAAPAPPPSMNLKYLGYAESGSSNMSALFIHGDDMFIAKTGDIMFHRFRVGAIQVSSVQVTDLTDNRTQSIAVAAN